MAGRKKTKTRRKRKREKPGLIGRVRRYVVGAILRLLWAFVWRLGLAGALVLAVATGFYLTRLPAAEDLFDGRGPGPVTMLDRPGHVFAWAGRT